jgi:hypothetical protein
MPNSPGENSKDSIISKGFNPKKKNSLSKAELRKMERTASLEKARLETQRLTALDKLAKLERQSTEIADKMGLKKDKNILPQDPKNNDDENSEMLLKDMRAIYKMLRGKTKLKALMQDDKQFLFMVRELMKMESAQMIAKTRRGDEENLGRTVFVVLKGLEEAKELEKEMQNTEKVRVLTAINPDGSDFKEG